MSPPLLGRLALTLLLAAVLVDETPAQAPSTPAAEEPGTAAERNTPLEFVPAEAVFTVRLEKPGESLDRIRAFLRASGIVPRRGPDPFAALGTLIGNPSLTGVDTFEDWWLVGLAAEQGPPAIVHIVPTDGVSAARRVLDARFGRDRVLRRGSWMVYSTSDAATSRIREVVARKAPSLGARLTSEQRSLLLDGELTVHVDVSALSIATLEGEKSPIEAALGRFGIPAEQVQAARDLAPEMKRLVESIAWLTVSVRVGSSGIGCEVLATPAEGSVRPSPTDVPPLSSLETIPRLPERQLLYLGASGLAGPAARRVVARVEDGLPRRLELRKRLATLADDLKGVEVANVVGSVGLGRVEGGALRIAKFVDAKPPEKVRAIVRREYANVAFDLAGTAQRLEISENETNVAGVAADELRLTVRRETPHRDWIDALYGRGGLVGHVVFEPDGVVQILGGDDEFGALVLRRLGDRTGRIGNGDLLATRNKLPEKAHLLALVDVPSTMTGVTRVGLRGGAIAAGVDPQSLDAFDRDRSYCGLSLGLEPAGARVAVVVPIDQIVRTRSVLEFLAERFRSPGS